MISTGNDPNQLSFVSMPTTMNPNNENTNANDTSNSIFGLGSCDEIATLINMKEKELKEIQEMRCLQLEKHVMQKDSLLIESGKRFNKMKEDFKYNLKLLEARDNEILRLENIVNSKDNEIIRYRTEYNTLLDKVAINETREMEQVEKYKQERAANKRILEGLKEGIESMKWASLEENKSKDRELCMLKEEVIRLNKSRDDMLDSQRHDLTATFEQLIHQREENNKQKEEEIALYVAQLTAKFEQLQTENSRIKSDYQDAVRKHEFVVEEIHTHEETARKLQWRLDDERRKRNEVDDSNQRLIQQLTMEVHNLQEAAAISANDISTQLAEVTAAYRREVEYSKIASKRLDECKASYSDDVNRLESELNDYKRRFSTHQQDIQSIRDERNNTIERYGCLRLEVDSISSKAKAMDHDNAQLREETNALKKQLYDADKQCSVYKSTIAALSHDIDALKATLQNASPPPPAAVVDADEILKVQRVISSKYDGIVDEMNRKIASLVEMCSEKDEHLRVAADYARERELCIEDEKAEAAALALRLRLQESKAVAIQQELQQQRQQQRQQYQDNCYVGGDRVGEDDAEDYCHTGIVPDRHSRLGIHVDEASSPVFSDDYGPVSLPASPLMMSGHHHHPLGYKGTHLNNQPHRHTTGRYLGDASMSDLEEGSPCHQQKDDLVAENDRLKGIIKSMRADVETLKSQIDVDKSSYSIHESNDMIHSTAAAAVTTANSQADERCLVLEERLQQAISEVVRLRQDKKKLMDTVNELRSTLMIPPSSSNTNSVVTSSPSSAAVTAAVTAWTDRNFIPKDPLEKQYYQHYHRQHEPLDTVNSDASSMEVQSLRIGGKISKSSISTTATSAAAMGIGDGILPYNTTHITNSERTLSSQIQARARLHEKANRKKQQQTVALTRVVNYNNSSGSGSGKPPLSS